MLGGESLPVRVLGVGGQPGVQVRAEHMHEDLKEDEWDPKDGFHCSYLHKYNLMIQMLIGVSKPVNVEQKQSGAE